MCTHVLMVKHEKPLLVHTIKRFPPRKISHHTTRSEQHQNHTPRQNFPSKTVCKGYSQWEVVRAHDGYYARYDVVGGCVCAYAAGLHTTMMMSHMVGGRGKRTHERNKHVQCGTHNLRPAQQRHDLSKRIKPQRHSPSTTTPNKCVQRDTDEERDGRQKEYPC